ncbi:MAG: Type II secretion system protein G [Microgenomates group bacterium GW2011_GWF2_45_18]|nr:MAG: Type II secretion system protein G [Microgenomates group bacterium GW2011_GWF1_44_10]KKU01662.1 MAG: Type II secretion system protein G [Microgenomates group bacterium GW2011_GWF2_45_18]OGJ41099.1 MAG: hypothetical protein A2378_00385 [Candidatus Pacebacteria bacterium RIFOXYB1_FULL_44_10]HAU98977.1 hypothetical protein [Candidatus Paceibacterota bacterium]HAX01648.1 hypothetical protein [Candidatus Paceibacterota bacterium]
MFRLFRSRETLSSTGFTMIELIIVIGILSAIIASILFSFRTSYLRGMDARRKSDLQAYKIALERYYDENDEYPDPSLLQRCGSADLQPYLPVVLCDPMTKKPYEYYRMTPHFFGMWTVVEVPSVTEKDEEGNLVHIGFSEDGEVGDYQYGITSGNLRYDRIYSWGKMFIQDDCNQLGVCTCLPNTGGGCTGAGMICHDSGEFCLSVD